MSIPERFPFLGIPGRHFFKFDMGRVVNVYYIVDAEIRTHNPKTHVLSTTPFVKEVSGYTECPLVALPIEQVLDEYSLS